MEILNLIIKKAWFDKIMSGEKKHEYRDIKPSTQKKYCEVDVDGYAVISDDGNVVPRRYDAIRFFVGYNKGRASSLVKVKGAYIDLFDDGYGNLVTDVQNGIEYCKAQITYELGEVIG